MTDFDESMKALDDQFDEAVKETDEALKKQLDNLKAMLKTDVEKLRPATTDQETYDKLIAVVKEATEHNENIGQIVTRLKGLAQGATALAKKILTLPKV
jgi:DNA anti-recombination protein RmuC